MSQQKIIRNVSNLDRGPMLTTDKVLRAVQKHDGEFTSHDIAEAITVREYQVRAALTWLVRRGIVERIGTRKLPLRSAPAERTRGDTYTATLYRLATQPAAADFDVLYRVFLPGGGGHSFDPVGA